MEQLIKVVFLVVVKMIMILITDVTSLTFGIDTAGRIMSKLIPRNTLFPANKSRIFTTYQEQ